MPQNRSFYINDDLFLQTLTCPLKYIHIANNPGLRNSSKPVFRQRNKLHIRDAIATRFKNCKHTSNEVSEAAAESREWLKENHIVVCGAVVEHSNLLTRIPILVKNADKFTIIQVHGKLRKQSDGDRIQGNIKSKSTLRYLLKAAYRYEVIKNQFPDSEVEILFCFPNKHFKSSIDDLHLYHKQTAPTMKKMDEELIELFTEVDATEAVKNIHQGVPENITHTFFANFSIKECVEKIESLSDPSSSLLNIDRHSGCKYCEFRLPHESGTKGCWEKYFVAKDIAYPEKHIFELIGHGNKSESKNGTYYQEEAELSRGVDTLQNLVNSNEKTISILQRRNLQILKSKDLKVPNLWLKQGLRVLNRLKYPIHFLDFEAATYALPMKKKSRPYSSVYFQFSCHTLFEDGKIVHSEWLDLQEGNIHPHQKFVRNLGAIPGINEGTIMQYSPFEKQGVNRLIADFKRWEKDFGDELHILENVKKAEKSGYEHRFFDVSKLIREFYFNEFLNDSLGLKQVLKSVLLWEQCSEKNDFFDNRMIQLFENIGIDFLTDEFVDPYKKIQASEVVITDGSGAMNAWLAIKNNLITNHEKPVVIKMLKKYCALDSLALFAIFKHISQFLSKIEDKDYILLNRNNRES